MEAAEPPPLLAALDVGPAEPVANERVVTEVTKSLRGPDAMALFGLFTKSLLDVKRLAQKWLHAERQARTPRLLPPETPPPEPRHDVSQMRPLRCIRCRRGRDNCGGFSSTAHRRI